MPSPKRRPDGEQRSDGPWSRIAPAAGVVALTCLSLLAKLINRFAFFVYPDSYYYLMIAENMRASGSPFGTLGPGGQPFPPEGYAALKSAYPAIVALMSMLGMGSEAAGHLVTTAAAVAAVPVAYAATKRLAGSRAAGLAAAALVATSYSLTYWSGFVMTDPLSVLLAFALIALVARRRADDWSNGGDLGTGLVLALLLLSRPVYAVVIPALLWLGVRDFGWTRRRIITAGVAAALPVSLAALLWFPPAGFAARLAGNLLPVLGVALAAGGAVLLARRLRASGGAREGGRIAGLAPIVALAAVVPIGFMLDRAAVLVGMDAPLLALHRFALRDAAAVLALVPGAAALMKAGKRDTAVSLLVAALVVLGVYIWVDPADSRYLVHLLPFLVPVAASAVLLLPIRGLVSSRWRAALGVVLALALLATVYQGARGLARASVADVDTDYLHAVANGVEPSVRPDDVLLSAVPWPYYYRLRLPTWGASVLFAERYRDYLPPDTTVLVLADDALWLHYPELAGWLERGAEDRLVDEFDVSAVYGYQDAAATSGKPVRLYRLTARELEELVPVGYTWQPPVATP